MPRKKKEEKISVLVKNTEQKEEKKEKPKKATARVSKKKDTEKKERVIKTEESQEVSKTPTSIEWRAAEYEFSEKSIAWQSSVIGATLLVAIIGFWMENLFFGIFILLAGGLMFSFSRRRPEVFDFKISEEGIEIKGKLMLPFEKIKNFSMRERPGMLNEILVRKNVNVNPYVRIPIDDKTGERVIEILRNKIPEVEYEESIIDLVSDWLGL